MTSERLSNRTDGELASPVLMELLIGEMFLHF